MTVPQDPSYLGAYYLLDPEFAMLNNGSCGAVPLPVWESFLRLQRELELYPGRFIDESLRTKQEVRAILADYLGTAADNIALVTNATTAMNYVIRNLNLQPGDEVLSTNQEYNSVDRTWAFMAAKCGFKHVSFPLPGPVTTPEALADAFWQGVTPRTRVISFSHLTAPTALFFPVQLICQRARQAGILTVVDGAHVPGQIDLNLDQIGADFYTGNLHKWACTPKGTAFLYARPDMQHLIEPLIVNWTWTDPPNRSHFSSYLQEVGTQDPSRFLVIPEALRFMEEHDWPAVRARCHRMVTQAQRRVCELSGLPPLHPVGDGRWCSQMTVAPLPPVDVGLLRKRLVDEHKVDTSMWNWNGRTLIRLSIQAYNTQSDIDRLIEGLKALL